MNPRLIRDANKISWPKTQLVADQYPVPLWSKQSHELFDQVIYFNHHLLMAENPPFGQVSFTHENCFQNANFITTATRPLPSRPAEIWRKPNGNQARLATFDPFSNTTGRIFIR